MNSETKFFIGIMGVTLAIILGAAVFLSGKENVTNLIPADILIKTTSQVLGATDSKVTIVEFSDFECSACKAAQPIVKAVLAKYPNKVRLVYRHFPIPSHQYGFLAAQAAESASLQGKFWEMHDKLFEKSPELSTDKLIIYASELKLDIAKFAADLESDAVKQKVLDDQLDGNKAGINVTPTFFINGQKFEGVLSVDQFSREIDKRL
ncbi:MAG: thioredoxin domain-containing protein [Patescibacteria group bacterium]